MMRYTLTRLVRKFRSLSTKIHTNEHPGKADGSSSSHVEVNANVAIVSENSSVSLAQEQQAALDGWEKSDELQARIKAKEYDYGADVNDDAKNIVVHALSKFSVDERRIIPQEFLKSCVNQVLRDMNIHSNITSISDCCFNLIVTLARYIAERKIEEMSPNELEVFFLSTFTEDVRPSIQVAYKASLAAMKISSTKDIVFGPEPLRGVCELHKKMNDSIKRVAI